MCCCTFFLLCCVILRSLFSSCLKEVHAKIFFFEDNTRFKEWLRTRGVGTLARFYARSGAETVALTGTIAFDERGVFVKLYGDRF
jgi:hypothetical protein